MKMTIHELIECLLKIPNQEQSFESLRVSEVHGKTLLQISDTDPFGFEMNKVLDLKGGTNYE